MADDVVKITHLANVNVVDGVPQCNCCHEPMVEIRPNTWQCQLGVALLGSLAAELGPAIDAYLLERPETTRQAFDPAGEPDPALRKGHSDPGEDRL